MLELVRSLLNAEECETVLDLLEQRYTALSLPAGDSRSLVLTLTYFVVVFSILVQSLTVGRVIRMTSGRSAATPSFPEV